MTIICHHFFITLTALSSFCRHVFITLSSLSLHFVIILSTFCHHSRHCVIILSSLCHRYQKKSQFQELAPNFQVLDTRKSTSSGHQVLIVRFLVLEKGPKYITFVIGVLHQFSIRSNQLNIFDDITEQTRTHPFYKLSLGPSSSMTTDNIIVCLCSSVCLCS